MTATASSSLTTTRMPGTHGLVDTLEFAPAHGTGFDGGKNHTWDLCIDSELSRSVDLVREVGARNSAGKKSELSGCLDYRLFGKLDLRGLGGEFPVTQRAA